MKFQIDDSGSWRVKGLKGCQARLASLVFYLNRCQLLPYPQSQHTPQRTASRRRSNFGDERFVLHLQQSG